MRPTEGLCVEGATVENTRTYDAWIGHDVYDSAGTKLGEITDIYYDDVTNKPEWVEVKTGFVGGKRFVPLQGSTRYAGGDDEHDDDLQVIYTEDFIKEAPKIKSSGEHLTPAEEQELWNFYGYDYTARDPQVGYGYGKDYGKNRPDTDLQAARYDRERGTWAAPGETVTAEQGGEVVSEATAVTEHVQKTQTGETVRLRKYQFTEMVPVTREEIRVETGGPGDEVRSSDQPSTGSTGRTQ